MPYIVSSGVTSNVLFSYDSLTVLNGGVVNNTRVRAGGYLYLSSGGVTNSITVGEAGWLSDGFLHVFSGGTANNTIVVDRGFLAVSGGGVVNSVSVCNGGNMYLSSGGTATAVKECGGNVQVENGAQVTFVSNTISGLVLSVTELSMVNYSCSFATLHSGTTANGTIISGIITKDLNYGTGRYESTYYYPRLTVFSGGTANNTGIRIGELVVSNGGVANSTLVNPLGSLFVSSGGTATVVFNPWPGTVVSNAGAIVTYLDPEAAVYYGNQQSGLISREKDTESLSIAAGYSAIVYSGGSANSTTVNAGGSLYVSGGGSANSTTVNSGGNLRVYSGGTANSTTVNSSGYLFISNGGIANSTTVNAGGSLYVSGGGSAMSILENGGFVDISNANGSDVSFVSNAFSGVVLSQTKATVHSGTTANSTTVNFGGNLHVSSGGTANSTTVNSRGYLFVSSGGSANDTILDDGFMVVLESGTANSITVNTGGSLYVSGGGSAMSILENGGFVDISNANGSDISFVANEFNGVVLSQAKATVHSGTTANSTTVNFGGNLHVSSGGTANSTMVNSGGYLYVSGGGTANSTTVNSGGCLYVSSGGSATISFNPWQTGSIVSEDGAAITYLEQDAKVYYRNDDGVITKGDVIDSIRIGNGQLIMYSGGTVNSATIIPGASLLVSEGVTANDISVMGEERCYCMIYGGGYTNHSYYDVYGSLLVSGGMANRVSVVGGQLVISDGGTVNSASVRFCDGMFFYDPNNNFNYHYLRIDGIISVSSGGTANDTTVSFGGNFNISGGGTANDTTVSSGGQVTVSSGGTASDTTVSSGGSLSLSSGGKLTGRTTFSSESVVSAFSGAIVDFDLTRTSTEAAALVNDLSVVQGATLFTLTVDGELADGTYKLADGASEFNKTISVVNISGSQLGTLSVGQTTAIGGVNYSLSLANRLLSVTRGGSASSGTGTFIIGDTRVISAGQTSSGLTVISSGKLYVSSGGTANSTTVSNGGPGNFFTGGSMVVSSGGTANYTTVNFGYLYVLNGGTANSTMVNSGSFAMGGSTVVSSGGTANYTTVSNGGYLIVCSSGTANSTTVGSNGKMSFDNGGTANYTTVSNGGINIYGGTANYTTVNFGGYLDIYVGTVNSTTVNSGGNLYVDSGSTVNYTTVNFGGALGVYRSDCTANSTTVNSGGLLDVICGAANDSIVYFGGSMVVSSGGTASDTTVDSGGSLYLSSGGKLTGRTIFSNEAVVSAFSGAIIDFDLTRTSTGAAALVNDLSVVQGATLFTLTVDGEQADGTYKLADGASGFGSTISVMNTSGTQLGSLSVGQTASIIGNVYSLNLSGGTLSVTVAVGAGGDTPAPEPEPDPVEVRKLPTFTGDFAGNGKSMLAVKDENLVSIYRNKGVVWSELTLDDGWDVAGVGDFDGDGADDILRVHSSGLVIGEMSDGYGEFTPQVLNFRSEGWSILGTGDFNHNGKDDVLIANPTGASPTVGLLGYWESGVTWTLINGYSAEWEMVSTGDFNGDGKCDMLWRNSFVGNGGLTYNAYCTWIVDPPAGQSDWRMVSVANPDEWNFLCSGDFDGNGSHDIAMINGEGVVGIWGVSDGYLSSWSILSAVTAEWQLAGVGDFNGDGTDDIAWGNTDTGLTGYWQINDKNLTAWQNIAVLA